MIVTVTLNAALDITHRVARLRPGAGHRVLEVAERPGGKGINVARVLARLGHDVVVTGFAGGATGARIREQLGGADVAAELVEVTGESRRTVTVVPASGEHPTAFNEAGPAIHPSEWRTLLDRVRLLAAGASALVLSGSLPPGVPGDAYAELVRIARRAGVPVVLDADGNALLAGVRAGPDVVKPNLTELAEATGLEPAEGAARLRADGARSVVVSKGADGLEADTPDGRWLAGLDHPVAGNPTGAGDAAVAALTAGLVTGFPWPERLARAAALAAAAVLAPVAGEYDAAAYAGYLPRVRVRRLGVHESSVPDPSGGARAAHDHR